MIKKNNTVFLRKVNGIKEGQNKLCKIIVKNSINNFIQFFYSVLFFHLIFKNKLL